MTSLTEEQAIKRFEPFVRRQAQRYLRPGCGASFEDLVQEGLLAVALSFRQWSPTGGSSLFAWIRRPVLNALRDAVGIDHVKRANRRPPTLVVSLDAPIPKSDDVVRTLHDVLSTTAEPRDAFVHARFESAYRRLTARERMVLRCRYLADLTLETTGIVMALSRERVRQIERAALVKIGGRIHRAKSVQ